MAPPCLYRQGVWKKLKLGKSAAGVAVFSGVKSVLLTEDWQFHKAREEEVGECSEWECVGEGGVIFPVGMSTAESTQKNQLCINIINLSQQK